MYNHARSLHNQIKQFGQPGRREDSEAWKAGTARAEGAGRVSKAAKDLGRNFTPILFIFWWLQLTLDQMSSELLSCRIKVG